MMALNPKQEIVHTRTPANRKRRREKSITKHNSEHQTERAEEEKVSPDTTFTSFSVSNKPEEEKLSPNTTLSIKQREERKVSPNTTLSIKLKEQKREKYHQTQLLA